MAWPLLVIAESMLVSLLFAISNTSSGAANQGRPETAAASSASVTAVTCCSLSGPPSKAKPKREFQILHRAHDLRSDSAAAGLAGRRQAGKQGVHRRSVGGEKCSSRLGVSCSFRTASPGLTAM